MTRSRTFRWVWAVCAAQFLWGLVPAAAAPPAPLLGGDSFRAALDTPAGVQWSGKGLRAALTGLCDAHQVAFFLDRRLDPDRAVEFSARQRPLREIFQAVAAAHRAEVSLLDPLVYLGPPGATDKFATLAAIKRQQAAQRGDAAGRALTEVAESHWPALSTPRELLREWAAEQRLQWTNIERVPHDLWPACRLPPMPLCYRLSVVLFGFGATYQVTDAGMLEVVPWDGIAVLRETYPLRGAPQQAEAKLKRLFPEAEIVVAGRQVRVTGDYELHHQVRQLLAGRRVSRRVPAAAGETRYTINKTEAAVGAILKRLADQFQLEATIAPAARAALTRRVQVDVQDATRDELLHAVLEPVGLAFKIEGRQLLIDLADGQADAP